METGAAPRANPLTRLSVVIPACDEQGSVGSTVEHLHLELSLHQIPHEIVVVDDGSTDGTWDVLQRLTTTIPALRPVKNPGPRGFGRAVICGVDVAAGDAVVVMMADESDDCRDVVRYWEKLNEGYEAVFGSRLTGLSGRSPSRMAQSKKSPQADLTRPHDPGGTMSSTSMRSRWVTPLTLQLTAKQTRRRSRSY
jgi:glycosyltransferase involved in cell wall biosynthesis